MLLNIYHKYLRKLAHTPNQENAKPTRKLPNKLI